MLSTADRLRVIRAARGLSQADLAELVGVARETIARFETSPDDLPAGSHRKIASALGYRLDAPQVDAALTVLRGVYGDGDILALIEALTSEYRRLNEAQLLAALGKGNGND